MAESWVVTLLIFACAALAAHGIQTAVKGSMQARRRAQRRLAGLGAAVAVREELRRAPITARLAPLAALDRLRVQSGTRASPRALVAGWLGLGLFLALILPLPGLAARLAAGLIIAGLVVVLALRIRRARRLARFGEQLPEVIDVIVRSLKAGHPLPVSLALVARETPEPAGPEFAWVVDEINYGRSVGEALEGLHQRVGHPELAFLVAAVSIAHGTGGNLGDILARLARTLRERFRLARRVRALSAEGRFSGVALSALPLALFGLITVVSPRYYAEFWASSSAGTVVGLALGLLVVGNLVIYRLVNFRA